LFDKVANSLKGEGGGSSGAPSTARITVSSRSNRPAWDVLLQPQPGDGAPAGQGSSSSAGSPPAAQVESQRQTWLVAMAADRGKKKASSFPFPGADRGGSSASSSRQPKHTREQPVVAAAAVQLSAQGVPLCSGATCLPPPVCRRSHGSRARAAPRALACVCHWQHDLHHTWPPVLAGLGALVALVASGQVHLARQGFVAAGSFSLAPSGEAGRRPAPAVQVLQAAQAVEEAAAAAAAATPPMPAPASPMPDQAVLLAAQHNKRVLDCLVMAWGHLLSYLAGLSGAWRMHARASTVRAGPQHCPCWPSALSLLALSMACCAACTCVLWRLAACCRRRPCWHLRRFDARHHRRPGSR